MANKTLYELTDQVIGVKDMLDADFIDDETFADTMEGLTGDLEAKADGLLKYVANLKAEETMIADEIRRLQKRKKEKQNRQNRLRDYLRDQMQRGGISRIDCPLFSITLRKPSQVVEIYDLELIPSVFTTTEIKPDKALIKDTLKAGKEVAGCELVDGKAGLLIR